MALVKDFFIAFWQITLEMAPWLLLGFLLAGVLHVYFPFERMKSILGKKSFFTNLKAALLGVPLPLCSCGVIPTGISLYNNGASPGATNTFLISTPQTGVDSILASYAMLGAPLAIARPIIAFISGLIGGGFTDLLVPHQHKTQQKKSHDHDQSSKFMRIIRYGFVTMIEDLAKWLLIGIALASLVSILIPNDFFTRFSDNPLLEIFAVLLFSIPLYVCATGSIPIALALMLKGLSPGAAMVFLMAGPATNIATLTILNKTVGRKMTVVYLLSIVGTAVLFGFLLNFIQASGWIDFMPAFSMAHHDHHSTSMLGTILGAILLVLIARALFQNYVHGHGHEHDHHHEHTITENKNQSMKQTIKVEGMMCNHCKKSVENALNQLDNVASSEVNLADKEVVIEGNVSTQEAKKVIENLGYDVL